MVVHSKIEKPIFWKLPDVLPLEPPDFGASRYACKSAITTGKIKLYLRKVKEARDLDRDPHGTLKWLVDEGFTGDEVPSTLSAHKLVSEWASTAPKCEFKNVLAQILLLQQAVENAYTYGANYQKFSLDKMPAACTEHLSRYIKLESFVRRIQRGITGSFTDRGLYVKYSHGVYCLKYKKKAELVNLDQLLAMKDYERRWFNLHLGTYLMDQTPKYDSPMSPHLESLKRHGWAALEKYGNEAYHMFKAMEPVVMGRILQLSDPNLDNLLLAETVSGLREQLGEVPDFIDYLIALPDVVGWRAACELSQIGKCWLHPEIDIVAGAKKLQDRTRALTAVDGSLGDKARGAFTREYCRTYYIKNKRWPKLQPTLECPAVLKKQFYSNEFNDQYLSQLLDIDWARLDFLKNEDFDTCDDGIGVVKDSALGLNRSDVPWSINPVDYRLTYGKQLYRSTPMPNRKVTADFILSTEEVVDILNRIDERGFTHDEMMILLNPKELENKIMGRYFAEQSSVVRLWQTLTEHNISEKILKYFTTTTMTMNESELRNVLKDFSHFEADGSSWVGVSLDFSAWNTRWRNEIVWPIFRAFDKIFGVQQLFSMTHLFYNCAHFVINSQGHPAELDRMGEIVPSEIAWKGQLGGCEGLRQKGWTVVQGALISHFCHFLNYHFKLIGQGDNQVVKLQIPRVEIMEQFFGCTEERVFVRTFVRLLTNFMLRAGLPLNTDECFSSKRVLVYGRKVFIDQVEVPSNLKRIATICGDTNESLPTTFNMISTVSTGGQDAAAADYFASSSYVLANLWILITLAIRRPEFTNRLTASMIPPILTCSAAMNGLPVVNYFSYRMRGMSDHLTENYWIHNTLWEAMPGSRRYLESLGKFRFSPEERKNPRQLMLDPRAVPWNPHPSAEQVLKAELEINMLSKTRNPALLERIEQYSADAPDELAQRLFDITPCVP
eukprot:Polyplicarium_translucidae@DN1307_c0_g1_i1.p1